MSRRLRRCGRLRGYPSAAGFRRLRLSVRQSSPHSKRRLRSSADEFRNYLDLLLARAAWDVEVPDDQRLTLNQDGRALECGLADHGKLLSATRLILGGA